DAVGALDQAARDQEKAKATRDYADASRQVEAVLPVAESLASLRPLSLAETQKLLAGDEALIVLHAGSDAIYGSLVRATGEPRIWRSPIAAGDLDRRVAALRAGLDIRAAALPVFPLAEAHELYRLLLGPVDGELGQATKLLIV